MNIKKIIGTSMIALLVVAMGAGMVAAADPGTGMIQSTDSSGNTKVVFSHNEMVYANGAFLTSPNGTLDQWGQATADIYVVPERTWYYGNRSGIDFNPIIPPVTGNDSNIQGDTSPILLGTAGTGAGQIPDGEYDVFYDHNRNGIFDSTDAVNQFNVCSDFTVVPEFATIAIPVLALLGLVLFMRRKKD